jgi:asparagine synthase (glutamine-hydrolysing)
VCGITGIFHLNGAQASGDQLHAMTRAIAHRGPDGEGHWVESAVALGHRRLSIIDLSAGGAQPMQTEDGRYIMTYNGELYNYIELKRQLEKHNVHFTSRSDSEVLLKAVATWGFERSVSLFNGMFALAIYDKFARRLYLARDRFGVKPLYYAQCGATLLFGSEIKAIIANPIYKSTIDPEALVEYLTFQNFFDDRTLFKGVKLLPAGTFAEVSMRDSSDDPAGAMKITRYWDFHFEEPENPKSEKDYLAELSHLFQQSVSRQLISDVSIGAYLSGGMDSGSITAVASKQLQFMRTFTCGFDLSSASGIELSYDEREAAERMSYLFKTEHYEMVLKSGDLERVMPRLAYHLEEPRVGQSYPNFYIAQLASKFNKVVLAGTGGDELFGGYPWRYYRAVVNNDFEHYVDQYFNFWQRILPGDELQRACAPIWSQVKHVSLRDIFKGVFKSHSERMTRPEDYVNHSLYFECKTFLHGLMVVEDKLSMAHGLETRLPFLDNDLVDFAMRLPTSMKLGNLKEVVQLNENTTHAKRAKYFQKTNDGKLLLRKMMGEFLPKEVVEREKQGFSAPDASWFKGESIDYVKRRVLDKNSKIANVLDIDVISHALDEHLSGRQNRRLLIWSLLNLEELFHQYSLVD